MTDFGDIAEIICYVNYSRHCRDFSKFC